MTCDSPSGWKYRQKICRCDGCRFGHNEYNRNTRNNGTMSMRRESIKLRALAEDPTDWMTHGACAHPDIGNDVFFAEQTGASMDVYREARRICNLCPVRSECLAYAYRHRIEHGVWGGLSPRERRDEAKRRRRNVA